MTESLKLWAVVPAAGSGTRMGTAIPKQYLPLAGRTVIEHTLERLSAHPKLQGIVVALAAQDQYWSQLNLNLAIPVYSVLGGAERVHSVLAGLNYLANLAAADDWILVHDAARPCLNRHDLELLITKLSDHAVGGILAVPISDTVKLTDHHGNIIETVQRQYLWRALTPQMFRFGKLIAALKLALDNDYIPTDEAEAIEKAGYHPIVVTGSADNIKITHLQDLKLAEAILA